MLPYFLLVHMFESVAPWATKVFGTRDEGMTPVPPAWTSRNAGMLPSLPSDVPVGAGKIKQPNPDRLNYQPAASDTTPNGMLGCCHAASRINK